MLSSLALVTGCVQMVEELRRAVKGPRRPSVLDKPHIRGAHAVGDGKGRKDWAAWAPISRHQNNGFFKSLASELAAGHQGRKEPAVPLRTPSLHKGQKCQLSLPGGCLFLPLWCPEALGHAPHSSWFSRHPLSLGEGIPPA